MNRAAKEQRIVIMDLFADWCVACKELEHRTFSDPRVQEQLRRMVTLRVDFTEPDPVLSEQYGIVGLPAVLFLNADGSEIPDTRITGFVNPDEFIALFEKAAAAAAH